MTRWNEGSPARYSQREPDRLRLLDRIGQRLAGSLELDVTLREVAQILVPRFADHCFIDLFSGDKLIRRAEVHAGGWEPPPGTWARVGEPISYPPGHFTMQAMSRLETIVVPDTQADFYPAPSQESMSAADQAGITSVLASPLYARGEVLGAMSLALSRITDREDPHYDLSDGDLIGAIAGRVAVAIDNAMLFEAERRTALAFQQSLLPQSVPELDGLDVAFRYVPAKPLATQGQGIQTQVGGDWYDIIPLAAGRVGLVIGDVEGRGARAAATMGQLRAVLRAYAQDEKSPADIMRKLDEWVRSTAPVGAGGDPPTVSCIYLIYDAWSRQLTFANAGHAAPLMVSGGSVRPLEIRHKGVLLGVRGRGIRGLPTYREQTVTLPPGAAIVLYTDGLTDRRSRADGDGHYTEAEALAMLCEALLASPVTAGALTMAAEAAVPGEIDDDMAILVFRTSPEDLASVEHSFPAEPIMVSEARRLAQATFETWDMHPDQVELGLLLVSEVVTNAVLHASAASSPSSRRWDLELEDPLAPPGSAHPGSAHPVAAAHPVPAFRPREFTLRLRRGAESVWVEAFDPDLRLPRLRTARATDEGGRGLYLVEQLATRWGSRPTEDGKAVWFEIPLDGKSRLRNPRNQRNLRNVLVRRVAGAVGEGEHHDDDDDDPGPVLSGDRQFHLLTPAGDQPGDTHADQHQHDESGHLSVSRAVGVPSLPSRLRQGARFVAVRHAFRGKHRPKAGKLPRKSDST
jgi:serine phosphatase RsbU (regulator of sigma subunit)